MVAAGNQRRPRGRAQRGGVKLRVTQPRFRDTVHGWRRDDTAKCAAYAITLIIRHDEKDIGRTLGWHYGRRPIRFGIFGIHIDGSAKWRGRRWQVLAVYCRRGIG